MAMPDVFNDDMFSLVSLTDAINHLPYKPGRIGEMGLFAPKGITTTTAVIEERRGVLSLIPSGNRGGPVTQATREGRKVRSFVVPHIPYEDTILASEVQNVRVFGSEDQLESATTVVNDRMESMRQDHETTLEWLRLGALKGIILDGDGSTTLFNLFTEFGITPPSQVDFLLGTDTTKVGQLLLGVKETIEDALGAAIYDHVHCFAGRKWFKDFIEHPEVKYAYQYFQEGKMLREDPRAGFEYKGVTFEVYRGSIGGTDFIDETSFDQCYFFPVGVQDLFITYFAPADFMETVNTIGLPLYAKQQERDFQRGVDLHTQSNPLPICTRPGALVSGKTSN